ncbi:MAG: sensor histidine kinase [Bacteroidia bacterium]
MAKANQFLKWRFDVNTFRLLGRELITDRITAVFELVKNCYDANATQVNVDLYNVTINADDRKITISDNGVGMSYDDIENKWMVVGTNSKRTILYSEKPFNRRFVGEKGIGRFAVDKLGGNLIIKTKKKGDKEWLNVNINWDEYESKSKGSQLTLFTDIENPVFASPGKVDEQGTILEISFVNEVWTKNDIDRLYKELTKVVSPFHPLNPPFNIYVNSNEHKEYTNKLVKADAIKYSSHQAAIDFDKESGKQEVLRFDTKAGKIITDKVDIKSFGPVRVKLYFFDEEAKRRFRKSYKDSDKRIDGVKVYRDNVVTTPFAEFEDDRDKQRDVLGIDKRLWRDIFNKISTREVIGVVDITKEDNPLIIDATNRQDFVDNAEYRDLKEFIIEQLDVFSQVKIYERLLKRVTTTSALQKAGRDVKFFKEAIESIENQNPTLKPVLESIKTQAIEVSQAISKGISEQKKERQEFIRKENIYFSLMSLQDYAIRISHAVRTSLGKIKRMAEFFKNNFPNAKYEELFKDYALMIYDEMNTLNKVIDFMLSYAASNVDFEDFSVKKLIEELLYSGYKQTFQDEGIKVTVEIKDDFIINANKKFFQDIIQNLVANSIKALSNEKNKIIKCTGYIEDDYFIFIFSDNGNGINEGDEEKIFGLYYTTTAEHGGAGLGLFIVKTRIEALKGTVEVKESEFKPKGASFKITLPFKKNE